MDSACYRHLHGYKYQVMHDYSVIIDIKIAHEIETPFILLKTNGEITIKKNYAWDGPSGPTLDTRNFMRGSLVHDALYQLMRLDLLDYKIHREKADQTLKRICIEDGMPAWRAWYVYQGVRLFGELSAHPKPSQADTVICVPNPPPS